MGSGSSVASSRRRTGASSSCSCPRCSRATRRAADAVLAGVRRLDVLPDGTILALVNGDGTRLITIAPPRTSGRLAVALHPESRVSLRRGLADIVASRPALARIEIGRASPVRATLRTGHNWIRVHVPARSEPQIARIIATARDGAIATHRLVFHSSLFVPAIELDRAADLAERWGGDAVGAFDISGCRRTSAVRYDCRWRYENPEWPSSGTARFELLDDGVIRYTEVNRRSRHVTTVLMEPRPRSASRRSNARRSPSWTTASSPWPPRRARWARRSSSSLAACSPGLVDDQKAGAAEVGAGDREPAAPAAGEPHAGGDGGDEQGLAGGDPPDRAAEVASGGRPTSVPPSVRPPWRDRRTGRGRRASTSLRPVSATASRARSAAPPRRPAARSKPFVSAQCPWPQQAWDAGNRCAARTALRPIGARRRAESGAARPRP
jgi:hypothetical protein